MILSHYDIFGSWEPRPDTPEQLADRFVWLVDRLALIHPAFNNWFWITRQAEGIPFNEIRGDLPSHVAEKVSRDDYDNPDPDLGYWLTICNSPELTPRYVSLHVNGGCQRAFLNRIDIEVARGLPPDPTMVAYPVFKAALLAACECFDVTHCYAFPIDMNKVWDLRVRFRFGWLNYISPRLAPLVTPPQSAIVEYRPNGALFMAATDETFVTSNPQHMAVARDIETALAPLNALPEPF